MKPRPGRGTDWWGVVRRVKKMSARSSRWPKVAAHQAREVPHPSQVPRLEVASMVVVRSAWAVVVRRAMPVARWRKEGAMVLEG